MIWLKSRQNFLSNKLHWSRHSFLNLREEQVFQRYWFGKQTVLDLCDKLKWICSVRGRRTLLWSSCQCHLCIRFSGNKWTCKSWGHYLYQLVFNMKFTNQCTDDIQKKSINSSQGYFMKYYWISLTFVRFWCSREFARWTLFGKGVILLVDLSSTVFLLTRDKILFFLYHSYLILFYFLLFTVPWIMLDVTTWNCCLCSEQTFQLWY